MTSLKGTHKTKCMICGDEDNLVIRYNNTSMVDLCHSCTVNGHLIADKNTMMFIVKYVNDIKRINPGCHYGSEFTNDCIDKFEEKVWLGFFRDWIKRNKKVY